MESLEDRRLLAFDAQLVADISALQSKDASSWPDNIVQVGAVAYFTAETPTAGRELWRSDGTAAGTFMVKDINPGAGDGFDDWGPDPYLTNVNGYLFDTSPGDSQDGDVIVEAGGVLMNISYRAGVDDNDVVLTAPGRCSEVTVPAAWRSPDDRHSVSALIRVECILPLRNL